MPKSAILFWIATLALPLTAQEAPAEFFESRIRPIFASKCYTCHTQAQLVPGIVPGNAAASPLIRAVSNPDAQARMPRNSPPLSAREIADLTSWIQAGAPWPAAVPKPPSTLWSLQPLKNSAPPAVKDTAWPRTQIDRFILAKLEKSGLAPGKPAGKRTLIRRATFDLIGLPPTPEEIDAFLADKSPEAFAKVVDRLLASPHYGERWGRHWLDVARYADGDGPENRPVYIGYGMAKDGFANTFRYRDWVVDAFNRDLPYDTFVKAQIAADLLPSKDRASLMPGLGFFGLGPWFTGDDVVFVEARANERDDKIDALTKGFLGLTVTCARCHDHKYDPIKQSDYYALGGIFASSGYSEYNLAPEPDVARYKAQRAKVKGQEKALEGFIAQARIDVARTLAADTARYMLAVRRVQKTPGLKPAEVAAEEKLDPETLLRWGRYLTNSRKIEHPFLAPWFTLMLQGGGSDAEAARLAADFQKLVLSVIDEKTRVIAANESSRRNYVPDPDEPRAALPGDLMQFERFQYKQLLVDKVMDPARFYVWLDVVQGEQASQDYEKKDGIYEYEFKTLTRFFTAAQRTRFNAMLADLRALEKDLPSEYPYLMVLADNPAPTDLQLNLRGNPHSLGVVVPRGLPSFLAGAPITGSGRLQLAEAIANHPLAARVMVNRIWMHHFGSGIVATPSNFGTMGEPPSDPELLDYLAARFIADKWSIKAMHREMMLSAAYQLGAGEIGAPARRRLEAEEVRDSLLAVSGTLDRTIGGPPLDLSNPANTRRTLYSRIRRSVYVCASGTGGVDRMLTLFDFPDPTTSVDHRTNTNVPLQSLFFLNSDLVMAQADILAKRMPQGEIDKAYNLLFGRPATVAEMQLAQDYLKTSSWSSYLHALLGSNGFLYVQ